MSALTKEEIKAIFENEGFSPVGFLNKKDCELGNWISPWIDKKYHADMSWMEKYIEIRINPCKIEGYANSIISAAFNYKTLPPEAWQPRNPISNYAWGEDYHIVLKKKLTRILKLLESKIAGFKGRACIDTAPLPEKIIAQKAGVGWIGKNSMLINRQFGSYLFLTEIVSNLDLKTDVQVKDYCGTCRKCIDACPTKAIVSEGIIDSSRCISYLTIEKRGAFTLNEKSLIDFQVFGCDICQQVCPWNNKSPLTGFEPFQFKDKWLEIDLNKPEMISMAKFEKLKIKSPVKRTKFSGFIRNVRAISDKLHSP